MEAAAHRTLCRSIGPLVAILVLAAARPLSSFELPAVEPGTSLLEAAEKLVPIAAMALVIPESAFNRAIATYPYGAPSMEAKQTAVDIGGAANDAKALGIAAKLQFGETSFVGDIFVVAREAASSQGGRLVETRNFFVASVHLRGSTPWVGTEAFFGGRGRSVSPGAGCCGPAITCVPVGGDPPGGGPSPYDPSWSLPLTTVFLPPGTPPPGQVTVFFFGNRGLSGVGLPPIGLSCANLLDPMCTVAYPVCDPSDFERAFGGSGPVQVGGTCGVTWLMPGHDLPPICGLILTAESVPAECGGEAPSLGQSSWDRNGGFLPPMCLVAMPVAGSPVCRRESEADRAAQSVRLWQRVQESGCLSASPMPSNNCCGAGCFCEAVSGGSPGPAVQVCTECTGSPLNTQCRTFTRRAQYDPRAAGETVPCPDGSPSGSICHDPPTKLPEPPCASSGNCPTPGSSPAPSPAPTPAPPGTQPATTNTAAGISNRISPIQGHVRTLDDSDVPNRGEKHRVQDLTTTPTSESPGDPVLVSDGSFHIQQTDLSFEGPARPLEFRRTYNSGSRARSTLGSNWHHNWDVRLQVLNEGTTPTWASPYCAGAPGLRTCLLLHDADASVQLFALDYMTGLYMPQAGSTDTVAEAVGGGWALRRANGAILMFNSEGYLVQDRDRFGSGFSIEYEPTPLFELFKAYCDESYTATASRACLVLGAMLEFIREPDSSSPDWNLSASDFPTPSRITLEEAPARARLWRLRNYFLGLLKQGTEISATLATSAFGSKSTFGARRLRPTKVTDDLGRTLMFAYNRGARPSPDDELLREVSGPAGTKLVFTYSRPPGSPISPEKLNEEFLVRVDRTDTPIGPEVLAAPTRQIAYGYQWPDVPGSVTGAQLAQYAQAVRDPYRSYYRAFIGCWRPGQRCGGSEQPSIELAPVPGDSTLLAEEQVREYLSDVFDNIIKVDQTGVTESETRYHCDPARLDFDRVSAQRYGATQAQASAMRPPPDFNYWTTTLPRMTFWYASAGPLSTGGDRTDAFLPAEILERYPLETPPAPLEPVVVPPHAAAGSDETCHLDWLGGLRAALPGYRGVYKYYQDTPRFHVAGLLAAAAPLMRTPLSCDTLALAQMSDPTHNDLLSELDPIPNPGGGTSEIGTARRIVGQRVRVAADANRICGWSKVVDRDGDLHYYGLNYRGQALVNVVLERATGSFIYSERLYNADGNPVIDRRPTRGQRPWTRSDGYTLYSYDEKRLTGGSEPLNDWLPVFWSRRANLQAVTEFARGGSVTDIAQAASVVATTSVGRYKQMSYEPLFNQLLSVEEGSFGLSSRSPHSRTDYVFDYQELSLTSLKPILDELRPWGFRWSKTTGPPPDYDYPAIQWQLPVTFYGADLNGDGKVGLYGSVSARGVPVLAVRTGENGERQEYAMTWAPHGKPAGIAGPDGSLVLFDYYSVAAAGQGPYGLGARPAESEVSGGNRSFLGRVRTRRFAPAYVSGFGPTAAPCASLAGPYQWLLPSSCSSNPGLDLVMLGLAPEAVSAITRTVRGAVSDKWQTSSFGYSVLGKVSRSWSDTGEVSVIRDADGRERAVTDELGSLTVNTYDQQGLPTFTVRTDKLGVQIGATRRQFDDEGKLSYRCNAKGANGCTVVGRMAAPDGVEERFEYGPEGTLDLEVDGEGLRTVHQYDERQQLRKSVASKPPTPGTREVAYQYNLDGDVENVRHGDATTFLGERMEYDGLRRLKRYVDKRGYSWHLGHSDRDLLSRYKQDADTATYSSGVSTGKWESTFEYDGLHRLSKRTDNGVASTTYSRTNAGNVYRVDRTGLGASYTTYDSQGQPVWESDGAGNQVVHVSSFSPYLDSTVEVRLDGAGGKHTTSEVAWLDAAGLPSQTMEYASEKERRTFFLRNGSGFVTDQTDAEGFHTLFEPNFLGWPDKVQEQSPTGYDVAQYTYNGRGQLKSVIDPSGLETSLEYDGFGGVASRTVHSSPLQVVSFTYDALGRLDTRTSAVSSVQHHYDFRGDPDYERPAGRGQNLSSRNFDELGRMVDSFNYNSALSWLSQQERTVQRSLLYDALGRVKSDTLKVGTGQARAVTSNWSLSGGVWRRALGYPGGSGAPRWAETFDAAGRLARKERSSGRVHSELSTNFSWEGQLYTGRSQTQSQRQSPFTEKVSVDELGQVVGLDYSAISLNGTQPVDTAEGQNYCGGPWSAAGCAAPLYSVQLLRDKLGRVVSDKSVFGYPVLDDVGNRVAATHSRPWKGFGYDAMSRLAKAWTHPGVGTEVTTGALPTHSVTAAQIEALGLPATPWQYQRETTVGDLKAVVKAGTYVWQATNLAHQQETVTVDGQKRTFQYDTEGRLTSDSGGPGQPRTYEYDVRGPLAVVRGTGHHVLEAYAYDDAGRLVATFEGGGAQPEQSFAYDGVQMVAGYEQRQAAKWEAAWGPGLDRLLEWRDREDNRDYLPLTDYRGSVVATWEEGAGRVRETAEYNPEGRATLRDAEEQVTCEEGGASGRKVCPAPANMPFGFQSAWKSGESGLVYMRNRWYSPELGVFITQDPLGYHDSFNAYAYTAFDPINGWDPFGLDTRSMAKPRVWGPPIPVLLVDLEGNRKRYPDDFAVNAGQKIGQAAAVSANAALAGAGASGIRGAVQGIVNGLRKVPGAVSNLGGRVLDAVRRAFSSSGRLNTSPMPSAPEVGVAPGTGLPPVNPKVVFPNLAPTDPIRPITPVRLVNEGGGWVETSPGIAPRPAEGRYVFVTKGERVLASPVRGDPGHIDLAGGGNVSYAGEATFGRGESAGQLQEWTNASGHYLPDPSRASQALLPMEKFRAVDSAFFIPQKGVPVGGK